VKIKNIREDIMANADRQVAGVGPGATDEPFYQMPIDIPNDRHIKAANATLPNEIQRYKDRIFEIFGKMADLRGDFQKASDENPSVKESQKVALDKVIKRLDILNQKLIQIPDFLVVFEVDLKD